MNLPVDLLRTFVTIAETGGFTSAGAMLGRSQPAISLQIKRLEAMVRAPLFERSGRRLQITNQGVTLLDYAHRILRLNDEVVARVIKPQVSGAVRLGIPNDFAVSFLTEVLGKFAQSHPNVTLEVSSDLSKNLLAGLKKKQFDLVIAEHENPALKSVPTVWTEALVWATSSNHTIHTNVPLTLVVSPEGCIYRNRMIKTLNQAGRRWRIAYTSLSLAGIHAAVLAGLGVTVLTKSMAPDGLRTLSTADKFPKLGNIAIGLHYECDDASEATSRLVDYITTKLGRQYNNGARIYDQRRRFA